VSLLCSRRPAIGVRIPAAGYEQITALKQRRIAPGRPVKKSELLRAGRLTLFKPARAP
jgi:hypothetical protein